MINKYLQTYGMVVGIDLGTCHIRVYSRSEHGDDVKFIIPSIVKVRNEYFYDMKRYIGVNKPSTLLNSRKNMYTFNSCIIKGIVYFYYNPDHMYSVETLFDHIIKSLYERAKSLGINIKKEKCVITVPSYFDNKRRSVISHICKQNHLNVTRFLNESTSVVLNHIHMEDMIDVHINESSIILVVDIGGGTTDFTIATVGSDFIRVLGTSGNIDLGGNILTDRLCRYLSKKYDFASNVNIWFLSEHIKTELSKNEHTKFMTKFGLKIIRRSTFDSLINDISDNCISMLLSLLKRTNYITPDIKTVIYSGGCSNVPLLRSMISDTLSGAKVIPLYKDEFAVCHGACLMLSSIVICNKFLIDVCTT